MNRPGTPRPVSTAHGTEDDSEPEGTSDHDDQACSTVYECKTFIDNHSKTKQLAAELVKQFKTTCTASTFNRTNDQIKFINSLQSLVDGKNLLRSLSVLAQGHSRKNIFTSFTEFTRKDIMAEAFKKHTDTKSGDLLHGYEHKKTSANLPASTRTAHATR
jgi:hypothetical protein